MTDANTGNLYVVSAPSGAGKSSLVRALLEKDQRIRLSVSYTSRAPRPGEEEGLHYHFVSREDFLVRLEQGEFLESAEVYGNFYGTSHAWIRAMMHAGEDILLEIDWQGASQVRRLIPEAIGIFILPPSIDALRERLEHRGQDSAEVIAKRMAAARDDITHAFEYDYIVVNDRFETALDDLLAIVRARRLGIQRQMTCLTSLIGALLSG